MTRLVATDPIAYRKPARCGKRLWLKEKGFEKGPQDEFSKVLAKLGLDHEAEHATNDLPNHIDLGDLELGEQVRRTLVEVAKGGRVVYQGAFAQEVKFGETRAEVVGLPDFLIPDGDSHIVRDAKLARTIGSKRIDIQLQLQIYGWLYETATGHPPTRLEVYNGKREIDEIPIDHEAALDELGRILELKLLPEEPFEPVGYTKCGGCAYHHYCWPVAEETHAPGLIPAIDAGLGWALHELGIRTYEEVGQLGEAELAEVVKPHGQGEQRFGPKRASLALAQIQAFEQGRAVQIGEIALPEASHFVMFDVEDLPPDADGPDQVYLWGLQVYPADGGEPGTFEPALSGFGENGDIEGWSTFLLNAKAMLDKYGDNLRFVHWHHHEEAKLKNYAERYPKVVGIEDVASFVQRLLDVNCLDLLRVTKGAFALPLPSYSLKKVESFVGYERVKVPGYKGDQSIARYMLAVETDDEGLRLEIVDEVCAYNNEDLEATWAVMEWLLSQKSSAHSTDA